MHISRWATIAAAALMLAAGCGSPQATSPTSQAPTAPSPASSQPADEAGYNDADIAFAQRMIPHHAQAIEMAAMATTHATAPEVRELADDIKQAQQPEIDQMTGWLQTWGAEVPSTNPNDMGGMDHGTGGSMPGMMSPEQMNHMSQARGAQFDRLYLDMMIEHHEGAIEMAQAELNDGENREATQLAQKIITDQQAEINQMRALLQEV